MVNYGHLELITTILFLIDIYILSYLIESFFKFGFDYLNIFHHDGYWFILLNLIFKNERYLIENFINKNIINNFSFFYV